jgi:hypothetical protein
VAGGNYFRQFPRALVRRAIARWDREVPAPFVMYFHTWELDPELPRISSASWPATIRQYRNLRHMESMIREYLGRYSFHSVADHLSLSQKPASRGPSPVSSSIRVPPTQVSTPSDPRPVTVVIPCYNEEHTLSYLANTLREVSVVLEPEYRVSFIFVDDGSRDRTRELLGRLFGDRADCQIVHSAQNEGVTAAILRGIRLARSEIVCSIDCDCSYDPRELGRMIPLLEEGVELVTASPYHPEGSVRNVPRWRLSLSRTASAFYRLLLRQDIRTYTSCFRVYRRSALLELNIVEPGFLGIAEILGQVDLQGGRIVEHPTTLEARMLGRSKMKILRTIAGHLSLMGRLAWLRVTRRVRRGSNPRISKSRAETGSVVPKR